MPTIKVNRNELSKWDPIEPVGWKQVEVLEADAEGKLAQSGKSTNHRVRLGILGPDNQGKEVSMFLNSSAPWIIVPLFCACDDITEEELFAEGDNVDLDLSRLVGKKFDVRVGHVEREGKIQNDFQEFAPFGTHGEGSEAANY
jgi:hypothetical protein